MSWYWWLLVGLLVGYTWGTVTMYWLLRLEDFVDTLRKTKEKGNDPKPVTDDLGTRS